MNKKLIGIVLGVGALVAIGLGVVLSLKTKELKSHIQQTLNTNLESFASKHADLITQWEPISCSGIIKVGCYSPKIVIGDSERKAFILKDVGFDIDSMDSTSLKASLNIKDIKLEDKSTEQQGDDEKEWAALLLSFMPHKLQCDVSLKHDDDKLLQGLDCTMTAKNISFQIKNDSIYEHADFKAQSFDQILQDFYFKWLSQGNDTQFNDYKYRLKSAALKIQGNGFRKDIYKLYELKSKQDNEVASQEGFEKAVAEVVDKFVRRLISELGSEYSDKCEEIGDAITSLALGTSREINFLLQGKRYNKDYYRDYIYLKNLDDEVRWYFYITDQFFLKVREQ